MEYEILGYKYILEDELWGGIQILNRLVAASGKFGEEYRASLINTCSDMDGFINSAGDITNDAINSIIELLVDSFGGMGVYTLSVGYFRELMDKDGLFEPLEAKYKGIVEEYYEMVMSAEGEVASREYRKNNRSRMVGGYGTGLINGNLEAGAFNLASGAAHSIANSIGNASTKSKLKKDGQSLLLRGISEMVDCYKNTVITLMLPSARILHDEGMDIRLSSESDTNKAKAIMRNIDIGNVPKEDVPENIIKILELDPTVEDVYAYVIAEYGDEKGELRRLAKDIGIDTVEDCIEVMVTETVLDTDFYDVDKLEDNKKIIVNLGKYISVDTAQYIDAYDEIIKLHNEANAICDGNTYDNEDELRNAEEEMKKFLELTNNIDGNNEENLIEIKKVLEGFSSKSKDKYVSYIDEELAQYDKRRRRVNGVLYDTREETDRVIDTVKHINELLSKIEKGEETLSGVKDKIAEIEPPTKETSLMSNYLDEAIAVKDTLAEKMTQVGKGNRLDRTRAIYDAKSYAHRLKKYRALSKDDEEKLNAETDELCKVKNKQYTSLYEANSAYCESLKNAHKYSKDVVNKKTDGGLLSKLSSNAKEYLSKGYEEDYKYFIEINDGVLPPLENADLYNDCSLTAGKGNSEFDAQFKDKYNVLGKEYHMEKKTLNGSSVVAPKVEVTQHQIATIMDAVLNGAYSESIGGIQSEGQDEKTEEISKKQLTESTEKKIDDGTNETISETKKTVKTLKEELREVLIKEFGDDEEFINKVLEKARKDSVYKILIDEVPNHGYTKDNVLELVDIFVL